jgi:hypothetical protein
MMVFLITARDGRTHKEREFYEIEDNGLTQEFIINQERVMARKFNLDPYKVVTVNIVTLH